MEHLPLPQSKTTKPKEMDANVHGIFTTLFFSMLSYFKRLMSKPDNPPDDLEAVERELGRTIVNKCFKKTSCVEKVVTLTYDSVKYTIQKEMKKSFDGLKLLVDIANDQIDKNSLIQELGCATGMEINSVFLWSAFCKRWELLEELVRLGANINFYEPTHGLTVLHIAAFRGCVNGTKFLTSQKINVNTINKWYSPLHCTAVANQAKTAEILLDNGARLNSMTNGPNYETPLYIAVKANAIECVNLFVKKGAHIYQEGKLADMSPLFLAAELGHAECLKTILSTKTINSNELRETKNNNTALHLAAERGHRECIEVLLSNGADSNLINLRNQTPLHLAVKANSYTSVILLLTDGNANVNMEDVNKRTPLHEAIELKADSRKDIVKVLLGNNANVNAEDQHGFTPLHIAALNERPQCVELLISHGADFSIKTKTGISAFTLIAKKTPDALEAIKDKFNEYITLESNAESLKDTIIRFDFKTGLHHPNEYALLSAFVDEGYEEMLLTPFCTAFLYVTWCRIRRCYYGMIYNSLIFSLMLLVYVLTALAYDCDRQTDDDLLTHNNTVHCKNKSYSILRDSPVTIEMQWYILLYLTLSLTYRKTYGIRGYTCLKRYFLNLRNVLEWSCIFFVFLISCIYTGKVEGWQVTAGGFAVISSWSNVMLLVGQLPFFGPYVEMFQKVQSEFFKLLLVYFSLLFGCTIGFCVFFPNSPSFANPLIGMISTLVMMTGEMNYDILLEYEREHRPMSIEKLCAQGFYTLFVLFITIILMNLLIGIAVHDIEGLQKTADLSRLVRQAKVSSYIELAHLNRSKLSKCIMAILRVVPKPYVGVIKCKPLDPAEKTLPKAILQEAYNLARKRENSKKMIFNRMQSEKSSWKKIINNSFKRNYSELRLTATLNQIVHKQDQNLNQIKSLQTEINELKEIIRGFKG